MDRYYLGSTAGGADSSDEEESGALADDADDAMGERSLHSVQDEPDEQTPPGLRMSAEAATTTSEDCESSPSSRDAEIDLNDPVPALPDDLLADVARAVEETEQTRKVARALAQLLIDKGILTLEEVQAQMKCRPRLPSRRAASLPERNRALDSSHT